MENIDRAFSRDRKNEHYDFINDTLNEFHQRKDLTSIALDVFFFLSSFTHSFEWVFIFT